MLAAARDHGYAPEGVLVQRMAGGGTELLLGIAGDPRFGPLVALAAGGATAELVRDVEVRLAPIGPEEAARMISGLRSFPLLDGFRGRPRGDIAALRDAVVRLGALAAGHPGLGRARLRPAGRRSFRRGRRRCSRQARATPPERPYAALGR